MVKQVKKVKKVKKVLQKIAKVRAKTSYKAVVRGRDNVAGRDIKQYYSMPTITESGRAVSDERTARNFHNASIRARTAATLSQAPSTWDNPPAFSSPYSEWSRPASTMNLTLPSTQNSNPQVGSWKTANSQRSQQSVSSSRRPYFRGGGASGFKSSDLPLRQPTAYSDTDDENVSQDIRRKSTAPALSRAESWFSGSDVPSSRSSHKAKSVGDVMSVASDESVEPLHPLPKPPRQKGVSFIGSDGKRKIMIKKIPKPKTVVKFAPQLPSIEGSPLQPVAEESESSGWSDGKSYRKPANTTLIKWVQQGHTWKEKPAGERNSALKKWNYKKGKWDYRRGDKRRE